MWIKHPQTWAAGQDCRSAAAAGRCRFAAQVSAFRISPFSSNQKRNSSHSTQANYFSAWKRQPNSPWRTKGKCDLRGKHIHHSVTDGSGNAARTRRRSRHRWCQQLPPNAAWEAAVISCSKGKAKPLLSQTSGYCWQWGAPAPGGYSWRRQRSPSPRGMQPLPVHPRVTQKTTNHPKTLRAGLKEWMQQNHKLLLSYTILQLLISLFLPTMHRLFGPPRSVKWLILLDTYTS